MSIHGRHAPPMSTTSHIKRPSTEWTRELLVQTAFGQGEIQATPLQMALVAAAVANGGGYSECSD